MIPIDLSGQAVVITGASRGIGRAMSLAFAKAGARLALNYREDDAAAADLMEELKRQGAEAILCKGSVSDPAMVEDLINQCQETWQRLDCLVNNAGITRDMYLTMMKEAHWDEVIDTNLKGAFLCSKMAVKKMIAHRRGAIINISSVSGVSGREGQANYSAAKAGLLGLTKSLAREVGRYNVRVNAIVAGIIDTDMTKRLPRKIMDPVLAATSLHRTGRPEEVANLAVFLASDLASYMTGSCISVDGGL
jgi:3-oxoacyl-[acyl-carrier protein] reductase